MKKLISVLVIFIIFCSSSTLLGGAFALNSDMALFKRPSFPKAYPKPEISLFSLTDSLESAFLEAFDEVYEGGLNISRFGFTLSEFHEFFFNILYNNPKYYYVHTFAYNPNETYLTTIWIIYYETDKDVIADNLKAIDDATDEILIGIDDDMTDFAKVMTVHNYMVENYEYNYAVYDEDYQEVHQDFDISIMLTKTGVCQAYSLAFKHLMNVLSIDCIFVTSDDMNHGWNLVKLGDSWYHIDLTWDDLGDGSLTGFTNKYALLSDDAIQNMSNPHYNYDACDVAADSCLYDNAVWRNTYTPIVTIDNISYYVDGNKLVSESGETIFGNLSVWTITYSSGDTESVTLSGLAERNGLLYFNTAGYVFVYNPTIKKIARRGQGSKIGNVKINQNTMTVWLLDSQSGTFKAASPVILGDAKISKPILQNGKIKTYIYKETDTNFNVLCLSDGVVTSQEVKKAGMSTVYFDALDSQTFFYWDDAMHPLKDKEIVNVN